MSRLTGTPIEPSSQKKIFRFGWKIELDFASKSPRAFILMSCIAKSKQNSAKMISLSVNFLNDK